LNSTSASFSQNTISGSFSDFAVSSSFSQFAISSSQAQNAVSASYAPSVSINTGSFATTGSNIFQGSQTFSGSITTANDTIFNGAVYNNGVTYNTKGHYFITPPVGDPSFIGMVSSSIIRFYGPANDDNSWISTAVNGAGDYVIINSNANTHIADFNTSSITFFAPIKSVNIDVTGSMNITGDVWYTVCR